MKINEWLNETIKESEFGLQDIREIVHCKDGFEISVQASRFHYCSPRLDGHNEYESVELGYPNREEELIKPFAEEPYYKTVYGYVPVEIVDKMIEKHGGIQYEKEVNE